MYAGVPLPHSLRLKCCPRCQGDLCLEHDQHGLYEHCLQCGYYLDLKVQLVQRPRQKPTLALVPSLP